MFLLCLLWLSISLFFFIHDLTESITLLQTNPQDNIFLIISDLILSLIWAYNIYTYTPLLLQTLHQHIQTTNFSIKNFYPITKNFNQNFVSNINHQNFKANPNALRALESFPLVTTDKPRHYYNSKAGLFYIQSKNISSMFYIHLSFSDVQFLAISNLSTHHFLISNSILVYRAVNNSRLL